MRRGKVTRRIAAAVLLAFVGLLALAVAPLVLDFKIDDAVRRGASLLASPATVFVVDEPIQLSSAPSLVLSAGTLTTTKPSSGSSGTGVKLSTPNFEISLDHRAPTLNEALPWTGSVPHLLAPLITAFASAEAATVYVQGATVTIKWSDGQSLHVSGLDAEISTNGRANFSAIGQLSYRGQTVKFEASSVVRAEPVPPGKRIVSWPLRLVLKAPWLTVAADGAAETGDNLSFSAQMEVQTPDTTKLAAWLGYEWGSHGGGPAMLLRGPAHWTKGVIAFGRSQLSLGDQEGIGAVSLSYRENRPLVEATVAFPALDVAPLLYTPPVAEQVPQNGVMPASSSSASPSLWRCLSTSFPAAAKIDADLRVSATRLQWRGDPVGRGAFSLVSRNGMVHADFSELVVGPYSGNLQIAADEASKDAPVTLRGRFQTANLGELARQLFAVNAMTGAAATQFEVTGQGPTLGDVVASAIGRGSIDARDGQLSFNLPAVQKLIGTPQSIPLIGWGPVSTPSSFESVALKFQLRKGTLSIDEGFLRSNALAANIRGRVGINEADLDVRVRLEPNVGEPARAAAVRSAALAAARAPDRWGDALAITGPWSGPVLSVVAPSSMP